jgi:hypothetical protein
VQVDAFGKDIGGDDVHYFLNKIYKGFFYIKYLLKFVPINMVLL